MIPGNCRHLNNASLRNEHSERPDGAGYVSYSNPVYNLTGRRPCFISFYLLCPILVDLFLFSVSIGIFQLIQGPAIAIIVMGPILGARDAILKLQPEHIKMSFFILTYI